MNKANWCRYSFRQKNSQDASILGCVGHKKKQPADPEVTPALHILVAQPRSKDEIAINFHVCSLGCALRIIGERE